MDDPHKTLGLPFSATQAEIKKAYHHLAQKYHPDTGTQADEKQFAKIAEAYRLLKNVDSKRKEKEKEEKTDSNVQPKQNLYQERIDPKRKRQQEAFYRSKCRQGILKVIGVALIVGGILFFVGWLADFYWLIGGILGLFFGGLFGMKRVFDLESFLKPKTLKTFTVGFWILILLTLIYLAVMILNLV